DRLNQYLFHIKLLTKRKLTHLPFAHDLQTGRLEVHVRENGVEGQPISVSTEQFAILCTVSLHTMLIATSTILFLLHHNEITRNYFLNHKMVFRFTMFKLNSHNDPMIIIDNISIHILRKETVKFVGQQHIQLTTILILLTLINNNTTIVRQLHTCLGKIIWKVRCHTSQTEHKDKLIQRLAETEAVEEAALAGVGVALIIYKRFSSNVYEARFRFLTFGVQKLGACVLSTQIVSVKYTINNYNIFQRLSRTVHKWALSEMEVRYHHRRSKFIGIKIIGKSPLVLVFHKMNRKFINLFLSFTCF
ncbi:hypothetical protein ACJX0J_021181, partial [Zea mays]